MPVREVPSKVSEVPFSTSFVGFYIGNQKRRSRLLKLLKDSGRLQSQVSWLVLARCA